MAPAHDAGCSMVPVCSAALGRLSSQVGGPSPRLDGRWLGNPRCTMMPRKLQLPTGCKRDARCWVLFWWAMQPMHKKERPDKKESWLFTLGLGGGLSSQLSTAVWWSNWLAMVESYLSPRALEEVILKWTWPTLSARAGFHRNILLPWLGILPWNVPQWSSLAFLLYILNVQTHSLTKLPNSLCFLSTRWNTCKALCQIRTFPEFLFCKKQNNLISHSSLEIFILIWN